MRKLKISLIIVVLMIISVFLIVTLLDRESTEAVISPNQIESEKSTSQLEAIKSDSLEDAIETDAVETDFHSTNDAAHDSVNELNAKPPSSGLDIMTDQQELAEQFNNEEQDYHWSGYWGNELQTIVLFVGAKAFVKDSEVECKSSTCEVTVNLSVDGPQNTVMALEALSQEFVQREMKFVPESIDPATGKIVFYTQPGDIPE